MNDLKAAFSAFRGRVSYDAPLAPYTWFRVGGTADALASPADEEDLAHLLAALPHEIPVTVVGVGSNLIVRDGGVRGVVIRLGGRAFGSVETAPDCRVIAGAAALDSACRQGGGGSGDTRHGVPAWRAGRDRRRRAHERRRARRRNQGLPGRSLRSRSRGRQAYSRQRRHGLFLSPQRSPRRYHLHPRGSARGVPASARR